MRDVAVCLVELVDSGLFTLMEYTDARHINKAGIETNNSAVIRFKREYEKLLNAKETLGSELFKKAVSELIDRYDIPLQ